MTIYCTQLQKGNVMSEPQLLDLEPVDSTEIMQGKLIATAVHGNETILSQLPTVQDAFEEPYRTVLSIVLQRKESGEPVDENILEHLLQSVPLKRRTASGRMETLTTREILNLLFVEDVQTQQAEGYLQLFRERSAEKKTLDFQQQLKEVASKPGVSPNDLLTELTELAHKAQHNQLSSHEAYPNELMEFFPYAKELLNEQTGSEFLGLDTGFTHINSICNGFDTGLTILAAPPGLGKTTWLWQVCCQVAQIERVPVVFVSLEQSKRELRAKALARLSRIANKHLLRGRLRSDDPEDRQKLLRALEQYCTICQYLTIIEGNEITTVDTVRSVVAQKISNAPRCLIAIDYLQKLRPRLSDDRRINSTKDSIDVQVSALRRMARDFDSPVVTISSQNRAGYNSSKLDGFKESGEIEYSADVAMVLTQPESADETSKSDYKNMDLKIIKNRNGETGVVKFKFYPKRAEFVEQGTEPLTDA